MNTVGAVIDIETLSTADNAKIIQISAIKFDNRHEVIGEFNQYPTSVPGQDHEGENTVNRWNENPSKRSTLEYINSQNKVELSTCLSELKYFLAGNYPVWANSPTFDMRILDHALVLCGLDPIEYWRHADIRTIKRYLVDQGKKNSHDSLDDCYNQLKIIRKFEDSIKDNSFRNLKVPNNEQTTKVD